MTKMLKWLPAFFAAGMMFAAPGHALTYDCSKAGNANKTACKTAATKPTAKPATAVKPAMVSKPAVAAKPAVARNYDCSKAGNANKTACKGAVVAKPASSTAAMAPAKTAPAAAAKTVNPSGPSGATAQCKDGTYSHSASRSGACSNHGGVKSWS